MLIILYDSLLTKGVFVRSMRAYGFETFIRVTVGTEEENKRFLQSFADSLNEIKYV